MNLCVCVCCTVLEVTYSHMLNALMGIRILIPVIALTGGLSTYVWWNLPVVPCSFSMILLCLWQICRDFLVGKCNRTSCRYVHSVEAKIADMQQRSVPSADVCKDFLNGRCNRAVCRFYHPPSTPDDRPAVTTAAPETSVCLLEMLLCVLMVVNWHMPVAMKACEVICYSVHLV